MTSNEFHFPWMAIVPGKIHRLVFGTWVAVHRLDRREPSDRSLTPAPRPRSTINTNMASPIIHIPHHSIYYRLCYMYVYIYIYIFIANNTSCQVAAPVEPITQRHEIHSPKMLSSCGSTAPQRRAVSCQVLQIFVSQMIYNQSGWWYTYPSEKWWSSSVGIIIPNIWKNKKCSKPPTSNSLVTLWLFNIAMI